MSKPLMFAFVSEYGFSEPAVVFAGSGNSLQHLTELLDRFRKAEATEINLNEADGFQGCEGTTMRIQLSAGRTGMKWHDGPNSPRLLWSVSTEAAGKFRGLVEGLISAPKPSHQYLDGEDDDVLVVVSKDEQTIA